MDPSGEEFQQLIRETMLRSLGFDEFQLIAAKLILDQLGPLPLDYTNFTPEQEELLRQLGAIGIEAMGLAEEE